MSYQKTNWQDDTTVLNAENMNHIENGIVAVEQEVIENCEAITEELNGKVNAKTMQGTHLYAFTNENANDYLIFESNNKVTSEDAAPKTIYSASYINNALDVIKRKTTVIQSEDGHSIAAEVTFDDNGAVLDKTEYMTSFTFGDHAEVTEFDGQKVLNCSTLANTELNYCSINFNTLLLMSSGNVDIDVEYYSVKPSSGTIWRWTSLVAGVSYQKQRSENYTYITNETSDIANYLGQVVHDEWSIAHFHFDNAWNPYGGIITLGGNSIYSQSYIRKITVALHDESTCKLIAENNTKDIIQYKIDRLCVVLPDTIPDDFNYEVSLTTNSNIEEYPYVVFWPPQGFRVHVEPYIDHSGPTYDPIFLNGRINSVKFRNEHIYDTDGKIIISAHVNSGIHLQQ